MALFSYKVFIEAHFADHFNNSILILRHITLLQSDYQHMNNITNNINYMRDKEIDLSIVE